MHPLATTVIAYGLRCLIGGQYSLNTNFWLFIGCVMTTVVMKDILHIFIGYVLDLDPLTSNDELWLYDFPINPINIPSFLVIKKTNTDP